MQAYIDVTAQADGERASTLLRASALMLLYIEGRRLIVGKLFHATASSVD